jgi:hypothetical protein
MPLRRTDDGRPILVYPPHLVDEAREFWGTAAHIVVSQPCPDSHIEDPDNDDYDDPDDWEDYADGDDPPEDDMEP